MKKHWTLRYAIESVKAAEEVEAAEAVAETETEAEVISEFDDEPVAEVSGEPMEAEQPLPDLPEDLAADDGVSTIDDPISVAAELLQEELDQYDADPFEDAEASEPVSALQDIPEIATEPEALLPTDDSAAEYEPLLADEDSVTEAVAEAEISASADLDAYVEDITNMQPVTEAPREEHHDDHDIAALLSQLAEIVSDDSVAEAVIQKIEEIAQEFSSHTHVQADPEPEAEPTVIAEDISEDILEAVDAVVNEEEISFDLSDDAQEIAEEELFGGEEPSAEAESSAEEELLAEELPSAEEEHLSEDELAAEFAAAMAAEADMDAASAEVPAEEPAIDEDVSEIEFPAELEEVASEPEPVPEMAAATPAEEMQCIIVEMHGLQLAMPLEHVLEPRHIADMSFVLDDQYDWVLGSFLDLNFKIDVVDTAMWLIPETYEPHNATYDEILLLQGKPWALTYDRMVTAQIISMDEVTLNTDKSRRPWLLGTSMAHKCAIVDIPALCKQLEEAL
ncbi:hypothetical protein [Aliamphritea spongicola]|nr:hypothetical protein [Aliamphritea spongicola]